MGVMAPDEATVRRLTRRLMDAYASRCAARAEVRDQACALDREWSTHADEVLCSTIPEGTLAKAREGDRSALLLVWSGEYGARVLTQGSHEHVDRFALDVIFHGPQGGPEFWNQRPGWHCTGGDDTLHAVTVGGEFRLMPLVNGEHLLMFSRNDGGLSVLGMGDPEALQRTAHERLKRFHGDVLHVRIGQRRVVLRDIGAAGVLGQVDVVGGDRLVLGHLAGDQFGLIIVHGETPGEHIGLYSLAELARGDLGQVLTWTHQQTARAQHRDDDEQELQPCAVPPAPASPPGRQAGSKKRRQRPPARVARLSAADLMLLEARLTPGTPATGNGATMVPTLFVGIRKLVGLGLDNLLLYGCQLKRLLEDKCSVAFHCCAKTFGRALAAVAAHLQRNGSSGLLTRVGRRWLLRLGDLLLVESELLQSFAEHAATSATAPASPAGSGPSAKSAADHDQPVPPRSSGPTPTHGGVDSPSAASEARELPTPTVTADLGGVAGGATLTDRADPDADDPPVGATSHGAAREFDEIDLWLYARGIRPVVKQQGVRARTVTMSSLPADQSASRWSGTKIARGPPDEPDEPADP